MIDASIYGGASPGFCMIIGFCIVGKDPATIAGAAIGNHTTEHMKG